ncbi:Response regulator receiver domain-containing protein [Sulfitobacter brevis]|uniref:Response regulator receiver domain-containing protein n=1 Tax=Sulfitobacter brevis TaxID=74348 RepID=A0A1I2AKN9_9RHOB|nr:response regulator [Sulfitobacter brevis]SFE44541.1 Response regulator receiver domain-containing protein [Sulfitobacter brevis]
MTSDKSALPAVLVVEDEPLIRLEAVDTIEDAGFRTYDAGSADAALKILEAQDDIGVLFTDVDMPGSMNGIKLAGLVRERWPSLAIIIASGIVDVDKAQMPEGTLFFPKPYPTTRIIAALQDIAANLRS